ncbi:MAG: TIR domain-containing protein [Cyanobacteria bacterium P01_G01_bin.39]
METFGKYLERFSLSVDIVREETKTRVINLIREYLDETLEIKFITLHLEGKLEDEVGLFTTNLVLGGTKLSANRIKNPEGDYCSQVALAYDLKKPMWIVNSEQQALRQSDVFTDLWSNIPPEEIPPYHQSSDSASKTSVIVPITDQQNKIVGVINMESIKYHEISEFLQDEIQLIAKCIKKIYFRHEAYSEQRKDTEQAIASLVKIKNSKDYLSVTKNKLHVFLASSNRAENDVIGEIRQLFNDFEDCELEFWKTDFGTGIINLDLLNIIKSCSHGIFYVSQPVANSEAEQKYDDNQNVLIEAGMMSSKSNKFENIIIIREENSIADLPFDLKPIKTIYVPRDAKDRLNKESFIEDLKTLIERMLFIE